MNVTATTTLDTTELDQRLAAIEQNAQQLAASVAALGAPVDVAGIEAEITALRTQLANVAAPADLGPLSTRVDGIEAHVEALAASIANLPAPVAPTPYDDSSLRSSIDALNGAVESIRSEIAPYDDTALRGEIDALAADAATQKTATADSLTALDGRVASLEAKPAPAPYDDSALVTRVGAVEALTGTLSPRVDNAASAANQAIATANSAATQAGAASAAAQAALSTANGAAKATDLSAALARITALEAAVQALQAPARPAWDPTDWQHHPFSQDSPWNTPVPANATYTAPGVDLSSNVNGGGPWAEGNTFGTSTPTSAVPVWVGKASDPVWTCYDPKYAVTRTFHAPDGMYPQTGPDHAAVVYDTTTGTVWSLYEWTSTDAANRKVGLDASIGGTEHCQITSTGCAQRNADGSITKAGVRASGVSPLAGMVTGANFAEGHCDHALAIILARGFQQPGPVAPALTQDSGAATTYTGGAGAPHEGSRLAIPPTTPMPAGLTAEQKVVWNTLVKFGGYVVDSNKGFSLTLEPTTTTAAQLTSVNSNGFVATVAKALRLVA